MMEIVFWLKQGSSKHLSLAEVLYGVPANL
jgi:hypothetical protein